MRKSTFILVIILVIAILIAGGYWFYYNNTPRVDSDVDSAQQNGFSPFGRGTVKTPTDGDVQTPADATTTPVVQNNTPVELPKLRQLSVTPVAGMSASTTKMRSPTLASTTIDATLVRYIDRGMGHVYQADDIHIGADKMSNTTLPKIYESYWNKNLTTVILRYLKEGADQVVSFYAELRPVASSSESFATPFEIKGKYLSPTIDKIAVSPSGDKIFTWNIESGRGIGYTSSFDEKTRVKILDVPFTQAVIDWPESNTITIYPNPFSSASGFLYSVDAKNGEMRKVMGGVRGLSAKMSRDAKQVLYSAGGQTIITRLFNIKDASVKDIIFKTLADKCIWSTLRKNEAYCAVPTEIPAGTYPDDWYKGTVSFVDKIWHLDTTTGEVHLLGDLLSLSNQLIDATQLTLDPKENYLYFINKRDLSLWSLDLNQ